MSTIAVVDYGMGNLRSVAKALEHVADNQNVIVTSDAAQIDNAERVVFPGQGAARDCMMEITDRDLKNVILKAAQEKPFLGICMGAQVLLAHSQENEGVDCLGLYPGEVKFFGNDLRDSDNEKLKIPHMGWNGVHHNSSHPLWEGIEEGSRFYFVHSYYMVPDENAIVLATTNYGFEFVSAIGQANVFAVQFHPEKSAKDGLQLLKNFSHWDGQQ